MNEEPIKYEEMTPITAPSRAWAGSMVSVITCLDEGRSFLANKEVTAEIAEAEDKLKFIHEAKRKLALNIRPAVTRARQILGPGAEFKTETGLYTTESFRTFVTLIVTRMPDL